MLYIYSLLALPLYTLLYIILNKDFNFRNHVPALITGLILASSVCFIDGLFFYSTPIWTVSLTKTFIHIYTVRTLIPIAGLIAIFFLFSRDNLKYKMHLLLSLLGAYYSVRLPFEILTSYEKNSIYMLLYYPTIVAAVLVFSQMICTKSITSNKPIAKILLIIPLIASLIPALCLSFFYTRGLNTLHLAIAIISAALLILAVAYQWISSSKKSLYALDK